MILLFLHLDLGYLIFKRGFLPSDGIVNDEEIAIKIAEIILVSIYDESIIEQHIFDAKYNSVLRYWEVTGTLPDNYYGGIIEVHIRKKDAKILFIYVGL